MSVTIAKRLTRTPKTPKKSRIQLLKDQPAVDIIGLSTDIDKHIKRAISSVEHGRDTLNSIAVTPDNVEATQRLLEALREDYDALLILYTQFEYAHKNYENSTVSYVKDSARANLYTESKGQSLLPAELT